MTALIGNPDSVLAAVAWLAGAMIFLALGLAGFAFFERWLIQRRLREVNRLKASWADPVWRSLFGQAPSSAVWALVQEDDVLDFVSYLFPLVRRLDGVERERLADLAHPFLERVRAELPRRSAGRRAMAVEALGHFGTPEDLPHLLRALDDRSPLVAMVAARALAERPGAWENARVILDSLRRFAAWDANFLATLVAQLGPEATPELRRTFEDVDAPSRIREVAALALRMLNDPAAADSALRVLDTSTERDLRAAALRALGQVGSVRHVDRVAEHLAHEDFVLRVAAVDAFARLSARETLTRLDTIVREDPSQWVAIHAARGLRDAGEVRLLEELALSNHPRSAVAMQAIMEGG